MQGKKGSLSSLEFRNMTTDQLQAEIAFLETQLNSLKNEKRLLQLEHDMIDSIRESERHVGEKLENSILLEDLHLEEAEKIYQARLYAYEQKIESLEFFHKHKRKQIQEDGEVAVICEDSKISHVLDEVKTAKKLLENCIERIEDSNQSEIESLGTSSDYHLKKLGETFESNFKIIKRRLEQQIQRVKETIQLRERVEIHQVEERKNMHINELMKNEQEYFEQLKSYYNEITQDNVQLINALRSEISEMKFVQKFFQKQKSYMKSEIDKLEKPLVTADLQKSNILIQLRFHESDEAALDNVTKLTKELEKKVNKEKHRYRYIEKKHVRLNKEINEHSEKKKWMETDIGKKATSKIIFLQEKAKCLLGKLSTKFNQYQEVLLKNGADKEEILLLSSWKKIINSKNDHIRKLKYEHDKMKEIYNITLYRYKSRLGDLGISTDHLSFSKIDK